MTTLRLVLAIASLAFACYALFIAIRVERTWRDIEQRLRRLHDEGMQDIEDDVRRTRITFGKDG